ncbi:TetR/AcrR family transcriptional regulator [Paenibacillus sp. N1-5-1-14]|uniref:TetR/AcrR family transcriptional regulator n=1 Tax=Paenibacillus radicibacter TaxID=2972488 RepID=UPI002159551D|nr:TetR/AcrR family transcriptional regulator [Paenibacillus radicibacter]MCR8645748.1 TetR/AcrR family transcriptional regulator [Paenibacillus radicibacter]
MRSEEADITTRDHILNTTLDMIKTEGIEAITVRKIATIAEVNVALVNYHFGSKDKLLNEAMRNLFESFKSCFGVLDQQELPPKQRLIQFLTSYTQMLKQHPGLFRQMIATGTLSFDTHLEFKLFLRSIGFDKIQKTLTEITGEQDISKLFLMCGQLVGAIMFPVLMAPVLSSIVGVQIANTDSEIENIVNRLLQDKQ